MEIHKKQLSDNNENRRRIYYFFPNINEIPTTIRNIFSTSHYLLGSDANFKFQVMIYLWNTVHKTIYLI